MREYPLPIEFSELSPYVNYVQKKGIYEYSSSCPKCGGHPHDGELPDRFIMFTSERKGLGYPLAFCRRCGYKWWQGKRDHKELDPKTIEILRQQAKQAEERQNAERNRKLQEFSTKELWEELHRRLGIEQRQWWRDAGIPDDWQDYLKLGYTNDKAYNSGSRLEHSPAYTIPYFGYQFVFKTMQYRLCNPCNPVDRYRFESGLGTSYYMTTPNQKINDEVVVCEGAKKGIVTKIFAEPNSTVLAVPSKSDWRSCGILDELENCGRVYIIFDPDCFTKPATADKWTPQPFLFAKALGKKARIVECPIKIDDAFIGYGMTTSEYNQFKKQAVRIA